MDITIEEAREILTSKILFNGRMPIYETHIYRIKSIKNVKTYSFRELLKYVYELQDIK